MLIWESKRSTFGSWVSTRKTLCRYLITTLRHPTSVGIHQPGTLTLEFLGYFFQKPWSKWKSRSKILDDGPSFARSENRWRCCSKYSEIPHAWCNGLSPIYGDRGHCQSMSDVAVASQSNCWWKSRRFCGEDDPISAREICKRDSEKELWHSRKCGSEECSMDKPSALYRCTECPYKDFMKNA